MTSEKHEIDLTNGSISRSIVSLVIPLILSLFLTQLFSTADQIVVGQLVSNSALAAVGSAGPLIDLLIAFSFGLSAGVTVACAKHKGENDVEKVKNTIGTGMLTSVVSGMVIFIVGEAFCEQLLDLTSTPENIVDFSEIYLRVVFAGIPFQIIYTFGAGILRSGGDTKRPMYLLAAGGVINVILNIILVLLLPEELGDKRVIGVAVGTTASHIFTAVGVLWILIKGNGAFKLEKQRQRFYKEHVLEVLKVGVPNALSSAAFTIASLVVQKRINSFGSDAITAFTVSSNLYNYICQIITGFRYAVIPFVGQNYGSKNYQRIKSGIVRCVVIAASVTLFSASLMMLFARPLLSIYTGNEATLDYGVDIMNIICMSFIVYAPGDILTGAMSGIDRSMTSMVIHLISICGVRILWIYLVFPFRPTVTMLTLAYTASWVTISSLAAIFTVYHMKKLKTVLRSCGISE